MLNYPWVSKEPVSVKRSKKSRRPKIKPYDSYYRCGINLPKPMGIIFEENDPGTGGVFVASLADGGAAAADATLKAGDQLVAVAGSTCKGADFDGCLGAIPACPQTETRLVFFRGPAPSLYGSLGASDAWFAEFLSKPAAP